MTYNKPEITVLGDASEVIRGKFANDGDSPNSRTTAACDLDEE